MRAWLIGCALSIQKDIEASKSIITRRPQSTSGNDALFCWVIITRFHTHPPSARCITPTSQKNKTCSLAWSNNLMRESNINRNVVCLYLVILLSVTVQNDTPPHLFTWSVLGSPHKNKSDGPKIQKRASSLVKFWQAQQCSSYNQFPKPYSSPIERFIWWRL